MIFPRCSGILLHISSLPSDFGIGDLGRNAHEFVDFLADSGQKIWQVLPLSPTGYGDSPYQCFSAFAGNPLFLDPVQLQEAGRLQPRDLASASHLDFDFVDYGKAISSKQALLRKAAQSFFADPHDPDLEAFATFSKDNEAWLDDYALFMAAKDYHKGAVWTEWDAGIRRRDPSRAAAMGATNYPLRSRPTSLHSSSSFGNGRSLKNRCHQHGIRIMGDIPIYVAHDSADVWSHPELFRLDEQGSPPPWRAFLLTTSARPDNFGETLFIDGMSLARSGHRGGSIVFGHRLRCSILCDWITFAVSKPIGKSRRRLDGR